MTVRKSLFKDLEISRFSRADPLVQHDSKPRKQALKIKIFYIAPCKSGSTRHLKVGPRDIIKV